jgi:hypothetical protein
VHALELVKLTNQWRSGTNFRACWPMLRFHAEMSFQNEMQGEPDDKDVEMILTQALDSPIEVGVALNWPMERRQTHSNSVALCEKSPTSCQKRESVINVLRFCIQPLLLIDQS